MFSIAFNVERSVTINKPISEVFEMVSNFNTWPTWSPWLIQEAGCAVNVTGAVGSVGHGQSWNGKQIGSGNMAITSVQENKRIDYDLFFLKPWKSQSKVAFIFEEVKGHTQVTWTMDGTLPVFMFWMKKMMGAWVGSDYMRGLTMLKDLCETNEVHSNIHVANNGAQSEFYYVGIKRECALADMGEIMSKDLQTLHGMVQSDKLSRAIKVIGIYEKFDMVNARCQFVSALTYDQKTEVNDERLVSGYVPSHNSCIVTHVGEYKHLGNAWSTGMGYVRSYKLKQMKKVFPYEVYENDPSTAEDKDLITHVHFPLKG